MFLLPRQFETRSSDVPAGNHFATHNRFFLSDRMRVIRHTVGPSARMTAEPDPSASNCAQLPSPRMNYSGMTLLCNFGIALATPIPVLKSEKGRNFVRPRN